MNWIESVKIDWCKTHKQGICTNNTDNKKEPFGAQTPGNKWFQHIHSALAMHISRIPIWHDHW